MEYEYADVIKTEFYRCLASWYLRGRFPCGWQHGRLVRRVRVQEALARHVVRHSRARTNPVAAPLPPDIRRPMSARVTDDTARQAWAFAERHPKDFENQITSTLNRFNRLLGPQVMKATFGQPDARRASICFTLAQVLRVAAGSVWAGTTA